MSTRGAQTARCECGTLSPASWCGSWTTTRCSSATALGTPSSRHLHPSVGTAAPWSGARSPTPLAACHPLVAMQRIDDWCGCSAMQLCFLRRRATEATPRDAGWALIGRRQRC
eukprot:364423-Chlamydomonas_euryale.AAC.5